MNPLTKGQRVMTPLGAATVLGFEQFGSGIQGDRNYVPSSIIDTDNSGRVAVTLDEPDNWLFSKKGAIPYIFRSQIQDINESKP